MSETGKLLNSTFVRVGLALAWGCLAAFPSDPSVQVNPALP